MTDHLQEAEKGLVTVVQYFHIIGAPPRMKISNKAYKRPDGPSPRTCGSRTQASSRRPNRIRAILLRLQH
jgi:hypothetical protein